MTCPLCLDENGEALQSDDLVRVTCVRCGTFAITGTACTVAQDASSFTSEERHWLPHALRRMQAANQKIVLSANSLGAIRSSLVRPTPAEAADNLIRYLGMLVVPLGTQTDLMKDSSLPYKVGVSNAAGVRYLVEELVKQGQLNIDKSKVYGTLAHLPLTVELTFKGWERFDALSRGAHSGRHAFMALQFGDSELDCVVQECFAPAIYDTGYQLRRLNDPNHQRAGLIDDELRVAIKAARFLVVDLTHNNNGAYWEAGFGEGLGKPVIYTCRKDKFEERAKRGGGTHFDTNHHLHILWHPESLTEVAATLKACVRATIPDASQND